jgi:A/G-specific adenine glycosylase
MDELNSISATLIQWYEKHKRELPWRDTKDAYKIWISEIILQQTRVNQGLDYYYRFIERFPEVQSLAAATEDEVLKYWQGLGYYSRARNLHKAAQQVVSRFGGKFPDQYADVLSLSGVGDYTAAAICSFAYNLPFAVVDGNVFRVLSRLFGIDTPIDSGQGKKDFKLLAEELLDKKHPGQNNQAIMEFGALQCTPVSPACESCPLSTHCIALASGNVSTLPVKTQKVKTRARYFNYLFIKHKNNTYLQKRTGNDVWKNLYEFPLIEADRLLEEYEIFQHSYFTNITAGINTEISIRLLSAPLKHVLTHQQIYAQCFIVEINEESKFLEQFEKTEIEHIGDYAVSRLMEILIQNHIR